MTHDKGYSEIRRLEELDRAKKLQAREMSETESKLASWCCVGILFLTLVVGFFS